MNTILLVEDSPECQLLVRRALGEIDYHLLIAENLEDARRIIRDQSRSRIDLFLLDLLLPDGESITLLNELQSHETLAGTPVFLLTSNHELNSKVTAFSLGAEDYLTKPIDPIELKARVEMRLRKTANRRKGPEVLRRGAIALELTLLRASIRGPSGDEALDLTSKEFKILAFLARNERQVYTRAQLVKAVWGEKIHVLDRTVDSHICGLRRKLGALGGCIESIPTAGYRFVTREASEAAAAAPRRRNG